jgi:hypothetical protein
VTVAPSGEVSVNGPPIVTGELAAHASGWLNTNAVATAMAKGIGGIRHKSPSRFSSFLDDFCLQGS